MTYKRFINLEFIGVKMAIASRMAYRLDYFISAIAMIALDLLVPLFILIVYGVSAGFEGWTLGQMLLLSGFVLTGHGIASSTMMGVLWGTYYLIRRGEFDLYLTKPGNALANLMHYTKDVEDIFRALTGIATLCAGIYLTELSFWQILLLVAMLPVPMMFFGGIAILASALSIKFVNTLRMYEFINMARRLSDYPGTIYPKSLLIVFLTFFPVAAAGFVPVGLAIGIVPFFALASIASVILFFTFTIWFWHHMIKEYTSAGG